MSNRAATRKGAAPNSQAAQPTHRPRTCLNNAFNRCAVCLDRSATHRIHDGIHAEPILNRIECGEGEAGFRSQRGHEKFLATGCLDGADKPIVFPMRLWLFCLMLRCLSGSQPTENWSAGLPHLRHSPLKNDRMS